MFLQATQLLHLPVLIAAGNESAGKISRLVFEPDNGSLVGLGVKADGFFFARELFLVPNVILQITKQELTISDIEDLDEAGEIVRIDHALAKKTPILHQTARTESGKYLGTVTDCLLDTTNWQITKYYLHSLIRDRILPKTEVHSITPTAVIFLDRVDEPAAQTAMKTETATA